MDSRQAIKLGIETGEMVASMYLGDLTDADLMLRPHAGCNHINWQVGHLVVSEHGMIEQAVPGSMPQLPAGLAEKYTKETAASNSPGEFATKSELLRVHEQQKQALLDILGQLSDSDLDKPTGVDYAPTVGAMFSLIGSHWLMHAGQWVIVRRHLGKPAIF